MIMIIVNLDIMIIIINMIRIIIKMSCSPEVASLILFSPPRNHNYHTGLSWATMIILHFVLEGGVVGTPPPPNQYPLKR